MVDKEMLKAILIAIVKIDQRLGVLDEWLADIIYNKVIELDHEDGE